MRESAFPFLRATFYRWMQVWPEVCPDLVKAPHVLGVGDLHVENFGTWRDVEGRLVWGVNDFDEAAMLPYTNDLVRLAASALLAIGEGHLSLKAKDACAVILDAYRKSLAERGLPFVLEEEHGWLRQIALSELRNPVLFWQKMESLPRFKGEIPASAHDALEHLLPEKGLRLSRRPPGCRPGQPRTYAPGRAGGLQWRQGSPRSQSPGAILRLLGARRRARPTFSIRSSSIVRCAPRILSCRCAGAGSFAACRLIAVASS